MQSERFATCAQIPDFGHAPSGSRLDSQNFAVIFEGDAIESIVVSIGTLGKLQTYIGPGAKETAIAFRPAGLFGQNGLMLGEIIGAFGTVEAKKLFRAFQTAVRKRAVGKARGAWICHGAYAFLQNGGQLSDHFDHQNGAMFPIDIAEVQLIA